MPVPLPLAPEEMVIQGTLLAAVHGQPSPVVTPTVFLAPPAGTFAPLDASAIAQPLPWLTVNAWPPIVSTADRATLVVAAAAYWTVPLPLPFAPAVTVSHDALLLAVHGHPSPAVTATLPEPPADGTLAAVGAIEIEHPLPCVTVTCAPATLMVPLRAGPLSGSTLNPNAPGPLPLVAVVNVIHGTLLETDQAQLAEVSIVADAEPPCEPKDCVSGATTKLQPAVCVIVTTWPATRTVPDRGPFAASTAICTVPAPVPLDPWVTVAHGTLLAAVQGQPPLVVTVTLVEPPAGPGE